MQKRSTSCERERERERVVQKEKHEKVKIESGDLFIKKEKGVTFVVVTCNLQGGGLLVRGSLNVSDKVMIIINNYYYYYFIKIFIF